MKMTMDAKIIEAGNGFPDVGDYISNGEQLYRVLSVGTAIHTTGMRGNWVTAQVEEADWDDCSESAQFLASIDTTIDPDADCKVHGCPRWRCDADH